MLLLTQMKITVIVKPDTKNREEIVEDQGVITAYTKAPATEGKANQAVIKLLSSYYKIPKTSIKLLKGATSKTKTFELP